jgi:DNA-binding NarL/FixJ family response regulator
MKRITVLLVEDHKMVREGLCKMLELEDDLEVVGQAKDGREAVTLVNQLRPAVVVMDIAMPLLNGLEATRQILESLPKARILILSAYSEDAHVEYVTASGAMGFMLKQSSCHELSEGIRQVSQGHKFFGPTVLKRHSARARFAFDRAGRSRRPKYCLTSREMEVLQLVAEGKANKESAVELGIGIKTVEKHREHLMEKLDIHDTAGLTRYAIGAGIIESSVHLTVT